MRFVLLLPILAGLALAIACAPQDAIITQDIATTIPWPAHEQSQYVLLDRKGETELGTGVLTADLKGSQYELGLHYDGVGDHAGETDDTTMLVNATTLKPVSLDRSLVQNNKSTGIKATYDDVQSVVNITEINDKGNGRLVPLRVKEHHYDNDSSLFLWRTIDFQEGYVANYRTVITGNRTQVTVTLAVKEKVQITVPAGTFDTWRVEIHAGDVHQVAWIADTPQRPLVQYDNSRQLFQLKSITAPAP
jgi:hypothetical protein